MVEISQRLGVLAQEEEGVAFTLAEVEAKAVT